MELEDIVKEPNLFKNLALGISLVILYFIFYIFIIYKSGKLNNLITIIFAVVGIGIFLGFKIYLYKILRSININLNIQNNFCKGGNKNVQEKEEGKT